MKTAWLFAVLIALSGCSNVENDLDACVADSMKNLIPVNERQHFQRACMGGKGYEFVGSQTCNAFQIWDAYGTICFKRR